MGTRWYAVVLFIIELVSIFNVYPFREKDRKVIEGFMFGLYDAVGKSGWYAFTK